MTEGVSWNWGDAGHGSFKSTCGLQSRKMFARIAAAVKSGTSFNGSNSLNRSYWLATKIIKKKKN